MTTTKQVALCPECRKVGIDSPMWRSGMVPSNLAGDLRQQYRCKVCRHRTVNPILEEEHRGNDSYAL